MKKYTIECTVVYDMKVEENNEITEEEIKSIIQSRTPFLSITTWGKLGTIDWRTADDGFKINSITSQ